MKQAKFTPAFTPMVYHIDEQRLRQLANEMAKDIVEPEEILKSLNFTSHEYEEIRETRAYKQMYTEALAEWQGAGNTQKRV